MKKRKSSTNEDSGKERKFTKHEPVSFLTHYQNSEKFKYKVGDMNDYKYKTYFFCDCPDHGTALNSTRTWKINVVPEFAGQRERS